jgi:hypothetical protein
MLTRGSSRTQLDELVASSYLDASFLDEFSDEELAAQVELMLPGYVMQRLRSRVPIVAAVLVVLGLVWLVPRVSPSTESAGVGAKTSASASPAANVVAGPASGSSTGPGPVIAPTGAVSPPGAGSPTTVQPAGGSGTTVPTTSGSVTIVDAGYASSTGGTPLERIPANGGLPVASASGQHLKRSFLHLAGSGPFLRLRLDAGATNVNADMAEISACAITESWQPTRGGTLAAGPAFSSTDCTPGVRSADGTWTFDLSKTSHGPTNPDGFALVPTTATVSTFDVTFSPDTAAT